MWRLKLWISRSVVEWWWAEAIQYHSKCQYLLPVTTVTVTGQANGSPWIDWKYSNDLQICWNHSEVVLSLCRPITAHQVLAVALIAMYFLQ